MSMKSLLVAGIGAIALGLVATSAEAAPGGGLAAIDREAAQSSPIETVTWYGRRHCWWHGGYRHCGYGYRRYGWRGYYGWGRHPYRYSYGYRRWWY